MGDQLRAAFENLKAVLEAADMSMADVMRLNYFTTDVDAPIDVLAPIFQEFLGTRMPASTLLGVRRCLAYPQLKIELEAIAGC